MSKTDKCPKCGAGQAGCSGRAGRLTIYNCGSVWPKGRGEDYADITRACWRAVLTQERAKTAKLLAVFDRVLSMCVETYERLRSLDAVGLASHAEVAEFAAQAGIMLRKGVEAAKAESPQGEADDGKC